MFLEESYMKIVEYGKIHHKLQGQCISQLQPIESALNSRLQKVQLRFQGTYGRTLVDTLLEHEESKAAEKNGDICWDMHAKMSTYYKNLLDLL